MYIGASLKKRGVIEGGIFAMRLTGDLSGFVHPTEGLAYQGRGLACPLCNLLRSEGTIGKAWRICWRSRDTDAIPNVV